MNCLQRHEFTSLQLWQCGMLIFMSKLMMMCMSIPVGGLYIPTFLHLGCVGALNISERGRYPFMHWTKELEIAFVSVTSDILCFSKCTLEQITNHCAMMFKLDDVKMHMNLWINGSCHNCGAIWINVIHVNRYALFHFGTT